VSRRAAGEERRRSFSYPRRWIAEAYLPRPGPFSSYFQLVKPSWSSTLEETAISATSKNGLLRPRGPPPGGGGGRNPPPPFFGPPARQPDRSGHLQELFTPACSGCNVPPPQLPKPCAGTRHPPSFSQPPPPKSCGITVCGTNKARLVASRSRSPAATASAELP